MKILIASSYSGGHVFPALALAEALNKEDVNEILFLKTNNKNIDSQITKKGFSLISFKLNNVSFDSLVNSIISVFKLLFASFHSIIILVRFNPDIVIGFGGYHSAPIVLLAHFFWIPTIIHEQNVLPGRANYILSRFVDRVAISFKKTADYFKRRNVVFTGCPIRSEIVSISQDEAYEKYNFSRDKFTILVMGGSQGSHNINFKFIQAISQIENKRRFQIIHITGKSDYEFASKEYSKMKINSLVFDFLEEMGYAYKLANIIVSRAGASTISEINALKIPAIIIPFPFAREHQLANAKLLADIGAAVLLDEKNLTSEALKQQIVSLINDSDKLNKMKQSFSKTNYPDAIANLKQELSSLKR